MASFDIRVRSCLPYSSTVFIYFMQEQDIYGILFSIGKNHGSFSANIAKHLAKEVFSNFLVPVLFTFMPSENYAASCTSLYFNT